MSEPLEAKLESSRKQIRIKNPGDAPHTNSGDKVFEYDEQGKLIKVYHDDIVPSGKIPREHYIQEIHIYRQYFFPQPL